MECDVRDKKNRLLQPSKANSRDSVPSRMVCSHHSKRSSRLPPVESVQEDPEQYEDLMVELYVGAWHLTENHSVAYLEKEGVPDFRIDIRDADFPVLIDCKRLRQRSAKRARKDVTKANTQIKNARTNVDPAYGILLLDASAGDFAKA